MAFLGKRIGKLHFSTFRTFSLWTLGAGNYSLTVRVAAARLLSIDFRHENYYGHGFVLLHLNAQANVLIDRFPPFSQDARQTKQTAEVASHTRTKYVRTTQSRFFDFPELLSCVAFSWSVTKGKWLFSGSCTEKRIWPEQSCSTKHNSRYTCTRWNYLCCNGAQKKREAFTRLFLKLCVIYVISSRVVDKKTFFSSNTHTKKRASTHFHILYYRIAPLRPRSRGSSQ